MYCLCRSSRFSTHFSNQGAGCFTTESLDKTALEISAHETLFSQSEGSADDLKTLRLLPTVSINGGGSGTLSGAADATLVGTKEAARNNKYTRKSVSNLLTVDASIMGNYDRDAMQMPSRLADQHQVPQVTTTSQYLPQRIKKASASTGIGNSSNFMNTAPNLYHCLERSNSNIYIRYPTDGIPRLTGKRQRASNRFNSSNNNTSNFSAPLGIPFPLLELEHPLPDYNSNWNSHIGIASGSCINANNGMVRMLNNNSSIVTLPGTSLPSGTLMSAGVDSYLTDYDSTLNSLWTTPGIAMGYDGLSETIHGQSQATHPPLYMTPDDELKLDCPQFAEFSHDLESYLCGGIESGASPTTPLGSSMDTSTMKTDIANVMLREQQLERLLTPAAASATTGFVVRRDCDPTGLDRTLARLNARYRGVCDDAHAASPVHSGTLIGLKNLTTNLKHAGVPSLETHHTGQTKLNPATSKAEVSFESDACATRSDQNLSSFTATADSTRSNKRPRTRQCEFPGCQNRARSHQKCKKHGGAHQCVFEGCTKNSQSRGLCIAHGGGSRCKREGCVRAAQSKGLCKSHGGGEFCAVECCNKKAHLKHLCRTHGGGVRCKYEKCSKWAQRKGWCMAHAKEYAAT
ncbi:hypothetical protein Plhal304r1_c036g0111211 [Plasmopara halstedii]